MKKCLVCIDSDGCAMDTMTIKHMECFGPRIIEEWNLEEWKEEILDRWNRINLYTVSRGINRFQGLNCILDFVDKEFASIEGKNDLAEWVENTPALSEAQIKVAIENNPGKAILKKVLSWSQKVNHDIELLPDDAKIAFPGVGEALKKIKEKADIAIVSSANPTALQEEWNRCGLMEHVDYAMAQDVGTKDACIIKMIEQGYLKENIVMLGDALGDYKAAKKAGVAFFPIMVNHEKESWETFMSTILDLVLAGEYTAKKQEEEYQKFIENLKG